MSALQVDRWAPVVRGDKYCAPGCGNGCTLAAFNAATQAADELAARMGAGWEPDVWENLGWHFRVKKGCLTVYAGSDGRFSAWIEPKIAVAPEGSVQTAVQFIEYADTPEDALGFATQAARTHMSRLAAALEDVLS